MTPTVTDFFRQFPTDDGIFGKFALVMKSSQKCGKVGKFYRLSKELAYSCPRCGHHIHPMVGTPCEKPHAASEVVLRHGICSPRPITGFQLRSSSASLASLIRRRGAPIFARRRRKLGGIVEVDETYIGGKRSPVSAVAAPQTRLLCLGCSGGDVMTKVVPNVRKKTLQPIIKGNVEQGSGEQRRTEIL